MSAEQPTNEAPPSLVLDDEKPPPRGVFSWLLDVAYTWGPAIIAVLLIRTFIFEPFRIPSGSMVPSLQIGDHVLVTKFSYGVWLPFTGVELLDLGDPARGDIIVFKYPKNPRLNYIKRVVGIPGDKVRVANNQIFIDGEAQERSFVDKYDFIDDNCNVRRTRRYVENLDGVVHDILTNSGLGPGLLANHSEITVPEGHVFVMGDNRDNSEDSRRWGFVRFDQIKGKAHFVWLSWNSCEGDIGRIRTERFFHMLYQDNE